MENKDIVKTYNDLQDKYEKEQSESLVESGLVNNEFIFNIRDMEFKVTKPTFGQKQEVYRAKAKKFSEFIKDSTYMLREDLKKQYKSRNIDVDEIEQKNIQLEIKKKELKEQLGLLLSKQVAESEYADLKNQIVEIENEQSNNINYIGNLMEFCIEHQLYIYAYSYLIMLVVYIKKDNKWVRFWNTYEEFNNTQDESLVNEIALYASFVIKDELK